MPSSGWSLSIVTGLDTKSATELEALASDFRERIARDPDHSAKERVELADVEWELEKRNWRKKV
jgi:hypothetical protein